MNEVDWLTGPDPTPLLDYLEGKVSERRLRLFACACCRRWWSRLRDSRARRAVEMAERFAEGQASADELIQAREGAQMAEGDAPLFDQYAHTAATAAAADSAAEAARLVLQGLRAQAGREEAYAGVPGFDEQRAYREGVEAETRYQTDLLRLFFGNPFRPIVLDRTWLAFNNGAVGHLARLIYDNDQYEDLPYLADTLLDAGCTHDALLRACREPGRSTTQDGQYGRGFWVIDLLLGLD